MPLILSTDRPSLINTIHTAQVIYIEEIKVRSCLILNESISPSIAELAKAGLRHVILLKIV